MQRQHKVLLVSHCVLNQNSVVKPLAREAGGFSRILSILADYPVGIVQMACPETLMLGMERPPMTREEYDTPAYRTLCRELVQAQAQYIDALRQGGTELVGVLGIHESPTCSIMGKQGILMQELFALPEYQALASIDVPENYHESQETDEAFHMALKRFMDKVCE